MIELSRKEKGTQVQAVSHFGWAQDPGITFQQVLVGMILIQ